MAGRRSKLQNPEIVKSFAEAWITGASREELAELFGVNKDTVTRWTQDPRVQANAARFAQERVNRITRKLDGEIEGRLENVKSWDTELILKVRKEYLDRALKVELGNSVNTAEATNELLNAMDEDPEFAMKLREMLGGG